MTIAQEEIFGPVLGVLTVKNDEEALKIASNSKYGLHASVFTQDINRAFHLAKVYLVGLCQLILFLKETSKLLLVDINNLVH